MRHIILDQVFQRVVTAKSDSDFTYFFSLLLAGEALVKTTTLGFIAAIGDDKDRNRYRLEHSVARSDGLGDWCKALEDVLTGPASQYFLAEARTEQTELTKLCRAGDWQFDSVTELKRALQYLGIDSEDVPVKSDMKRWFRLAEAVDLAHIVRNEQHSLVHRSQVLPGHGRLLVGAHAG